MGVDFERPEFFALGAEALPHWLHAWRGRSVPVKPRVCHAWGERRKRVRSGWFSPIAVNVCWGVGRMAGGVSGFALPCLQPEACRKDFCFGMGITVLGTGRGWVGSAQWIWGSC